MPRTEKCQFWGRKPKSGKLWKFITPLFFVQSDSTKAQINRLDKRNHLEQVAIQYLENWSFSLYSPFNVSWVHKNWFPQKTAASSSKIFSPRFFSEFLATTPTWANKKFRKKPIISPPYCRALDTRSGGLGFESRDDTSEFLQAILTL